MSTAFHSHRKKKHRSSVGATEVIKSLLSKIWRSLFVKLTLLMLWLYFGGLIWFFYSNAPNASWGQLVSLCHQSSTQFLSTVYYDYYELFPLFITPHHRDKNTHSHHHHNNLNLNCEAGDILNCEMERQQDVLWQKTNRNRDHCVKNVHDETFELIQVPQKLVDKHKPNSVNELLRDISNLHRYNTLSMELNAQEMKREFSSELAYCNEHSAQYLTEFAPVLGFHVLCFRHFPQYSQSLVVAYMNGYRDNILPSIPYRNRRRCILRNVVDKDKDKESGQKQDEQANTAHSNSNSKKGAPFNAHRVYYSTNLQAIPNGTYYVTNECERAITAKQANPKYLLITIKSMTDLRKHLQHYFIHDIGSHDEYTIEGKDITDEFRTERASAFPHIKTVHFNAPNQPQTGAHGIKQDPTQPPETEKFYERLELLREERKEKEKHKRTTIVHDEQQQQQQQRVHIQYQNQKKNGTVILSQYRKNPFGLYYPRGQSVSYYLNYADLFGIESMVFMFEGGRFMYPGVARGHVISLGIGPSIELETLNLRPLIFSIKGLITKGEVEYIRNKSLSRFNRSEVGLNEEKKVSDSRTCESAWLFGEQDMLVNSLKSRCERILQIPKTHMEDMEVVRYKKGERFDMHYDAFQQHDAASSQSQVLLHGGFKNRIATILYYLSDIDENSGGYTVFPRYDLNIQFDENGVERNGQEIIVAEKCCNDTGNVLENRYALKIKPESGKTILFYNMLPNGELDAAVLHGGCLLKSGQKWAANQWVWNRPFNA